MIKTTLYNAAIQLSIAIVLAVAAACSSSEDIPTGNAEESGAVRVVAKVAQQLSSRAYPETGDVEDGRYYLSYPLTSSSSYNVALVEFGKPGAIPRIGFVTVSEDKELLWTDVETKDSLYLDNVKPELSTDDADPTKIVFDPQNNPYKAGVFDGTNDLLWGAEKFVNGVKTANFNLHHYMSRLRVEVTVDRTNEQGDGDLSLEGAKVEISSINQIPIAYNRLNGSLELPEENEGTQGEIYTTLILVNEDPNENEERIEWKSKDDEPETYTTQDFVLPPQTLLTDNRRPRLTIKLQSGKEYSGILPQAMMIDDDSNLDHPELSYPVALSFLKEHILTIRTVITEEPPELAFMPVQVVQWVDKGSFSLDAHQAGIYTAEEFYHLIEYYQKNNEYQLTRYGREQEGKWVFDFFHSVTLDKTKIAGTMQKTTEHKDFSFNFNGYTIYIKEKEDASPIPIENAEELHKIVTTPSSTP